jgi:Protein of unknown function (DUF3040)
LTGYIRGTPSIVSLPTREQRVLDLIEGDLRGHAPRLASMFFIFSRLTTDDGDPRRESLPPLPRRRLSRLAADLCLAVPLALGMVALVAFLAVSSAGVHPCKPAAGTPYMGVATSQVQSCQAAQKP